MARRSNLPPKLHLIRGAANLGTITVNPGLEGDWYSGAFEPTPEFEAVRDLFERELALLQANKSDDSAQWDEWEDAHAKLHDPGLKLRAPDMSYQADEILIHVNGAEAWWRIE